MQTQYQQVKSTPTRAKEALEILNSMERATLKLLGDNVLNKMSSPSPANLTLDNMRTQLVERGIPNDKVINTFDT